jgi:hypothetical protein
MLVFCNVSCRLVNTCLVRKLWTPEKLHECHVPENGSFFAVLATYPSPDPGDGSSVVRRDTVLQSGRLWF